MVLSTTETKAFFTETTQMGIPSETVKQMKKEGITEVSDLADFDKDSLQQLADNLRRPGGRITDPNAKPGRHGDTAPTIPTPAFVFGAKSQMRLKIACELVRYYEATGRELTAANMKWDSVMKNFEIQWKALKAKKDEDTPDVPKITKALLIIKWTEAFQDFLNRVIGVRTIPLYYVIRAVVEVPPTAPALENNQPHSAEHGSVEAELMARASHKHALFRDDNASVYHYLEEATRTTPYAASIKPYQRKKDGRGAWEALTSQYAGKDKWEAEIKKQEQVLFTRVWKGQSNQLLESFVSQHRNAYVSMEACAEHVEYQLPNEHSRVGYLLDGIQCSDAGLQAAMASVKTDNGPNGKRNNFEKTAAHIIPYDPVAKKRASGTKRDISLISDVGGEEPVAKIAATGGKPAMGKSGVHLRFYKKSEYHKLSNEQKKELKDWREQQQSKKGGKKKGGKQPKKEAIIGSLKAEIAKLKAEKEELKEEADDEAYIMSIFEKAFDAKMKASAAATRAAEEEPPPKPTVNSILRRARFSKK